MQQGISEGYYREEIDLEIITRFRMESALLVFQNNLFPQDKYDIVKVNNEIFTNFIYGIVSIKGYKLISKYLQKS